MNNFMVGASGYSGIDLACPTIYKSSLPARLAELKAFDAAYTPAPD
jgi:hypothetical protein